MRTQVFRLKAVWWAFSTLLLILMNELLMHPKKLVTLVLDADETAKAGISLLQERV